MVSSDLDDDSIRYHIDWDDGTNDISDFANNYTYVYMSHQWNTTGHYVVMISAEDEYHAYSESSSFIVFVDVVTRWIDDELVGYFIDDNGDGNYDAFYDNQSSKVILVKVVSKGVYALDVDNDGNDDYQFNSEIGILSRYSSPWQGSSVFIYVGVVLILLVLLGVSMWFWNHSKQKKQREAEKTKTVVKQEGKKQTKKNTTKKK